MHWIMNPLPAARHLLAVLALCGLVSALVPGAAEAAKWDPRYRWNTLFTDHFAIHFHQGETELALELAQSAEEVHDLLVPFMDWEPAFRTQVVLVDPTDSANGYATTIPNNTIVIYAAPPTPESSLDNYEHWIWSIFVHEYAHILQIDKTDGVPKVLRQILGRVIMPGGVLPRWMTEGFATWVETRFSAGGRGRSTYTDMLLRSAALEGKLPRIDTADGLGHRWPAGQLRYLYGARFHFEVAERSGKGAEGWVDFHRRHGRSVFPLYLPAKETFGETFSRTWKAWRAELSSDYLSQAEAIAADGRGITSTRVLASREGRPSSPRYSPDGRSVLYAHSSAHEGASIRRVQRDNSRDERVSRGAAASLDGREQVLFSSLKRTNRYALHRDLYKLDLETGKRRRLSRGARLSDAALHPSGSWAVAVHTAAGQSQLVRLDLPAETNNKDLAQLTPLTAAKDGSHYAHPAWDPSGERLAVSVWKPGGFRDIHVFDASGNHLRALTWDRASDTDPVWAPDGEHLIFASDRDGIWNLYAYRWVDAAFFRVTRLLGGATQPDLSPDGRHIVFRGYEAGGWRLEEITFDVDDLEVVRVPGRQLPGPEQGPSASALAPRDLLEGVPGPLFEAGTGPQAAVARARARDDFTTLAPPAQRVPRSAVARPIPPRRETPQVVKERGQVKRYNPLRTLFPPRYLSLYGAITDTGALGGLVTGGQDSLSHHLWSASVHYRTDSKYFGGSGGYTLAVFHPRLGIYFSSIALDYGRMLLRNDSVPPPGGTTLPGVYRTEERYYERRDRLSAGVSVPLGLRHNLSARYKLEFRRPLNDLPLEVDRTYLPARGSFSGFVFGWSWGNIQKRSAGISPTDSWLISASLDFESSYLGAYRLQPDGSKLDLHRGILSAEARGYIGLPWAKGHVLALRGAAGGTFGTDVPQRTYRMGGAYGDNPYVSLPDRYYALRGYPTSSLRGNHFWLASAEYRLPLALVERGLFTAPAWIRSISLTLFAEAGQAWDNETYEEFGPTPEGATAFWEATRSSLGLELSGDVVLFWGAYFQGRVGYAVGFGPGAQTGGTFYAQLGSSF